MVTHISSDASQTPIMKKSNRGRCRQAILASCMALAFFAGPGLVWAGDSDKHRLINQQRVQELKERVADVREQLETHRHRHHTGGGVPGSIQTLESRVAALEAKVASMASFDPAALLQIVQSLQTQVATLDGKVVTIDGKVTTLDGKAMTVDTRVGDLEKKVIPGLEKYLSVNANDMNGVKGPHLVIEGANLHVRSGSGATDDAGTLKGLGNLIIGYNEVSTGVRTGSHNLVGGRGNAYPSYGGLAFGMNNTVSAPFGAVVSGEGNTAGQNAAVVGGNGNTASGLRSAVYGGLNVMAVNQNSYAPIQGARPAGN